MSIIQEGKIWMNWKIVNTNYYGSNLMTLKAIRQVNEVQDSLTNDLDDPEITSFKFFRLIKKHVTNQ